MEQFNFLPQGFRVYCYFFVWTIRVLTDTNGIQGIPFCLCVFRYDTNTYGSQQAILG